ncbi:enhancer of mRNA decapping [Apophysomyces sp. BC1015]|nr:enhancer of mRNA decapping [Apophysomyces sp. BC1015]
MKIDITGVQITDLDVIPTPTPQKSLSSETPTSVQPEPPKPKNVQPQKSKSKTKKDSKHSNRVPRTESSPPSSAQVPFVDPAIISMVSPEKQENSSAPKATEDKVSTSLESPSNTTQPQTTAPSPPKQLAKLLPSTNMYSQNSRRVLETVVFSDYKDFVKSRGRNGKRVTEPDKVPNANGVERESPTKKQINNGSAAADKETLPSEMEQSPSPKSRQSDDKSVTSQDSQQKQGERDIKVPPSLIPPKARSRGNLNGKVTKPAKNATDETPTTNATEVTQKTPLLPVLLLETEVENEQKDGIPIIKTVAGGIRCPIVTPSQMKQVEDVCATETGPNKKMMIENAGHGASVMALKAIGGHRRIQPDNHNAAPLVVILAGNNGVGSYSLAAARHLANRACQVIVFLTTGKNQFVREDVAEQKRCAEFAGARFVNSIDDLPQQYTMPVDLIIDALMGCQTTLKDLRGDPEARQLLWDAMDWANNNKAPVLSLDFPSGVNGVDGHPFHIMHHIRPKWTLCFGAPKQGCTSREVTGELFLADMGIPAVSWVAVGISRSNIPWGAEFVLALEYDQTV